MIKLNTMFCRYDTVKNLKTLLTGFALLLSCTLFSQSIFADLSVTQFGDSILINWTLKGGNTCVNMELQRSTDQITFEEVYVVAGNCGAATDLYYEYIDAEALNNSTIYFYRVTASNEFYVSDTVNILFVNAGDEAIFVYPNPSSQEFNITVDNNFIPPFLFEIFDIDGKQLNLSQLVYANSFTFGSNILSEGVYLLKITTEDGLMLHKKIVIGK